MELMGWAGVPVSDRPPTQLAVTEGALASVCEKLRAAGFPAAREGFESLALVHPAAAFDTKRWATDRFARVTEDLAARGMAVVAIAAGHDRQLVEALIKESSAHVTGLMDLSLPEVTALASRARFFVGNAHGSTHIAAATGGTGPVIS